jgi:chromosomal replication initiator protein
MKYKKSNLHKEFQFDNFIEDKSNKFAYDVAKRESKSEKTIDSSLLYIYGKTGLGKTHLIQAYGNAYLKMNKHVIYIDIESFMNEYTQALREQDMHAFRSKYNKCDLLILDDMQNLLWKEQTQAELLTRISTLINLGKKVVLAGSNSPYSNKGWIPNLLSYLVGGLVIKIDKPYSYKTKMYFVEQLLIKSDIELTEEVKAYIVKKYSSDIRMIKGMLLQIQTYMSIYKKPVSLKKIQSFHTLSSNDKEIK